MQWASAGKRVPEQKALRVVCVVPIMPVCIAPPRFSRNREGYTGKEDEGNMSGSKVLAALAVLILMASMAAPVLAQQTRNYGTEEWNAYIAGARAGSPAEKIQIFQSFLQRYPSSVLRVYIYPDLIGTLFQQKKYREVMSQVDNFLGMESAVYTKLDIQMAQMEGPLYNQRVLYTYAFLQSFNARQANADAIARHAAGMAREGLQIHSKVYATAEGRQDLTAAQRTQLRQDKAQQEESFHRVLAFVALREKAHNTVIEEYGYLLGKNPSDAQMTYQLGLSHLQKQSPDLLKGLWYIARSISLKVNRTSDIREFLTKRVAAYQQVVPACIASDIDALVSQAGSRQHPPAGWGLITAVQVNAVRQEMNMQRIFDDLKAGGDTAHMMWLASCGTEIPQLDVKLIEVAQENGVVLRVAAGQEAADSNTANMEVRLVDITDPGEVKAKAGDVVQVAGKLDNFVPAPNFLIRLVDGKVTFVAQEEEIKEGEE